MKLISKVNKNISVELINVISGNYDLYNDDSIYLVKDGEYICEEKEESGGVDWIRIYITSDVYINIMYYEKDTFFYTEKEIRKNKLEKLEMVTNG